jgi:hypothetical protein
MSDQQNEAAERSGTEDRGELEKLSGQFGARIEGLRELLEAIAPHAAALDRPDRLKQYIEQSGLQPDGQRLLSDLLVFEDEIADMPDTQSGQRSEETEGESEEESAIQVRAPDTEVSSDSVPVEAVELTKLIRHQPSAVLKVLRQFTRGFVAPRASLLNGSLLTVAIASFEFLLAGLYAYHLLQHPKQLETDEKEFSLADLVEIGSVQDAQQAIAERRVEAFMGKRLDEWSAWSQRILGQSFEELSLDSPHLNEMFQRRHIIVHSGGAVDRRYLQRVDFPNDEQPDIGDELPVSDKYLYMALDELEVLGFALLVVARGKWQSEKANEASAELNAKIVELMQANRWAPARKLAEVGCTLGQADSARWVIQVNGWLAMKRLDEFDRCRPEVEEWDVTALADKFKLAKACLMDEGDAAFELLVPTLKSSDVMPGDAWDWPLFDNLRADARFAQAFAEVGYARQEDGREETK